MVCNKAATICGMLLIFDQHSYNWIRTTHTINKYNCGEDNNGVGSITFLDKNGDFR